MARRPVRGFRPPRIPGPLRPHHIAGNPPVTIEPELDKLLETELTTGFDDGVTPWQAVYVRREYDEASGAWGPYQYSLTADFAAPYMPVGSVIPIGTVQERVQIGPAQDFIWADGSGFVVPVGANLLEITVRSPDEGIVAIGRDAGPVDAAKDQLAWDNSRYELEGVQDITNVKWVAIKGTGTMKGVFYYDPFQGNA